MDLRAYRAAFSDISSGARLEDNGEIVLCGRLASAPREASKKLFFTHLQDQGARVQILSEARFYQPETNLESNSGDSSTTISTPLEVFAKTHRGLRKGDAVAVRGFPGSSKKGELSIIPREVRVLAPCVQDIPSGRGDGKFALRDKGVRYRQRHVDMLANGAAVVAPFRVRAAVVRFLREYLYQRGFLEVETPSLVPSAGGALARPFRTRAAALGGSEVSLRIAPELYLKQLVVGGVDRVFELGKVFRNEGLSAVHNPEFTTLELYQAFADYEDLMKFTEDLFSQLDEAVGDMAREAAKTGAGVGSDGAGLASEDLKGPFKKIRVIDGLEDHYGIPRGSFPDVNDETKVKEVGEALLKLLRSDKDGLEDVPSTAEHSVATNCKLIDVMIGRHLEPKCIRPTFLCDHPIAMSPLAKAHEDRPGVSQRFELFVRGKEVVNAYSELNDPTEQMRRFQLQSIGREQVRPEEEDGEEVMPVDAAYCKALEYGLPPTAGWGLGIDRLVMMMTGRSSIRDVIIFPMLPNASSTESASTSASSSSKSQEHK